MSVVFPPLLELSVGLPLQSGLLLFKSGCLTSLPNGFVVSHYVKSAPVESRKYLNNFMNHNIVVLTLFFDKLNSFYVEFIFLQRQCVLGIEIPGIYCQ